MSVFSTQQRAFNAADQAGVLLRRPAGKPRCAPEPALPTRHRSHRLRKVPPLAAALPLLPPTGASPVILVVEATSMGHSQVSQALQVAGYRLLPAAGGKAAVRLARQHLPDLIVSTAPAPGGPLDYGWCQQLKADERTSHIPVLVLATQATAGERLRGLESGADCWLSQPFVPRELLVQVRNLLALRRGLRAAYAGSGPPAPVSVEAHAGAVAARPSLSQAFLARLQRAVEQHLDDGALSVAALSAEIALSRTQVHRKLKALTGQSVGEFIRSTRLHRAYALLQARVATVSEVAYQVGFNSPAHFSRSFSRQFGHAPSRVPAG